MPDNICRICRPYNHITGKIGFVGNQSLSIVDEKGAAVTSGNLSSAHKVVISKDGSEILSYTVSVPAPENPGENPGENPEKKGCGSTVFADGAWVLSALVVASVVIVCRKKSK